MTCSFKRGFPPPSDASAVGPGREGMLRHLVDAYTREEADE